ncbi:acyl-CoA dehydrogenase family protein [Microbacterium sp. NC79]|uniref:acyl-CoA dehydrogenase family protein n=1 Tax=Microbacterium sp. NC79 TaxID=2851009 RepID=UPI001C2C6B3F|nr:acyl-CoA dehydrogenase family protein [Microbacterium sp. NC79]
MANPALAPWEDRDAYDDDHREFGDAVGAFVRREVVPHQAEWEAAGAVSLDAYRAAGEAGFVGLAVPEQFGGGGAPFSYNCVFTEQVAYALASFGALRVHMDVIIPYVTSIATPQQQERWLPAMATAEKMAAIAMTEPAAGSDLAGMTTSLKSDGTGWRLNGSKTFITGGTQSELTIVVARSGNGNDRRGGLTLAVIEGNPEGLTRSQPQKKLGLHQQDTAELFFDDVYIPAENILGAEGRAFEYLSQNLAQERLSIAVNSQAQAVAALQLTRDHARDREMFGTTLSSFQNTKFTLADLSTRIAAGQALVDRAIRRHDASHLSAADAARVKLFTTELHGLVTDACLQLFGGYGYMQEQAIGRLYADARVARIYGGTSEVMKTIIAKSLGL